MKHTTSGAKETSVESVPFGCFPQMIFLGDNMGIRNGGHTGAKERI